MLQNVIERMPNGAKAKSVKKNFGEVSLMEIEKRIAKIERVSVRIFGLLMLLIAFTGLLVYASIELAKFVLDLWTSWK